MRFKHIAVAIAVVLSIGTVAATVARDARARFSSCATVLESEVCTWVVMQGEHALELGATIPLALIEAVPSDVEIVWPPQELAAIPVPPEARTAVGIDHLAINWEAHGHPPTAFLNQHFDFHFYSIPQAEVRAIDCSDQSKPAELPNRYVLPDIAVPGLGELTGLCVPRMGMHAMVEGDVHETDPFEASMMMGYYAGDPVFFEPMVSRELLLRKAAFDLAVPRVANLPAGVLYPSQFHAEYDAARKQYRMVFTDFKS